MAGFFVRIKNARVENQTQNVYALESDPEGPVAIGVARRGRISNMPYQPGQSQQQS